MMANANKIPLFQHVSWEVHPADEMFKTAKRSLPQPGQAFHYYFYSGGQLATRVSDYLRSQGLDPTTLSLLDFACGYGRLTRYFVKMFNDVTCSDLEPEMLTFVKDNLGPDGFLSNVELSQLRFPERRFDVVFCFSLFTHLNPEIWEDWFWAVFARTAPGGRFIFSTRGVDLARKLGEPVADGDIVRFTERNETDGRLDQSIYGQTTLDRSFVQNIVNKRPKEAEYHEYFPTGAFDIYHDIHVVVRR